MKRIFNIIAAASAAAIFASCTGAGQKVTVTNDSELDRTKETVELDFSALAAAQPGLTAENAVVLNAQGEQIPSQCYSERDGRTVLLFQADVPAGKSAEYTVKAGERKQFDTVAYSRYVPERMDDYAYENNLVAGRIYGPALADPRTFGSDLWLKCTDRLIIDEWFAKGDYHHNYGDGMDCYKVGNTLGGGALVPYVGEHLYIGDNYATQEHICDGPIRTKAYFTYTAFDVDGKPVSATREMSLDANSRFVKSTMCFTADAEELPVVLGAIQHDVLSREDGEGYISFTEKASDTNDPDRDGNISVGLVLSPCVEAAGTGTIEGHAVIMASVKPGEAVDVWTGSGWSQGGIESPEAWAKHVKDFAYAVAHPLKVTVE